MTYRAVLKPQSSPSYPLVIPDCHWAGVESLDAPLLGQGRWDQLYYRDNLDVLRRHIPSDSLDLNYLDPPFNSDQNYNILFEAKDGTGCGCSTS
jgi:hypothetical protein